MKKSHASQSHSASTLISNRIAELGDWRGKTLGRIRTLIKEADPDVVEELKWVKPTNRWITDARRSRHGRRRFAYNELEPCSVCRRQTAGALPKCRLNARLKAASDSYPTRAATSVMPSGVLRSSSDAIRSRHCAR
jgi:hypothetical protein